MMDLPVVTIKKEINVLVWGDRSITARVYRDKIEVSYPVIHWTGDTADMRVNKVDVLDQEFCEEIIMMSRRPNGRAEALGKIMLRDEFKPAVNNNNNNNNKR